MKLHDILTSIALGEQWSENALVEALKKPYLNHHEKVVLKRYLVGSQVSTDHIILQYIAIIIRNNK